MNCNSVKKKGGGRKLTFLLSAALELLRSKECIWDSPSLNSTIQDQEGRRGVGIQADN